MDKHCRVELIKTKRKTIVEEQIKFWCTDEEFQKIKEFLEKIRLGKAKKMQQDFHEEVRMFIKEADAAIRTD